MGLYGKQYLTTIEDACFVQLNVQWFKSDCVYEGRTRPSNFLSNPNNRETLITIDREGEYTSFIFETKAPSQQQGSTNYYRKVVTLKRTVSTCDYMVHEDASTFVKFIVKDNQVFQTLQIIKSGVGDMAMLNSSGLYMIIDLNKLDLCETCLSVYPFNTIYPIQGTRGHTYIKWRGQSEYVKIIDADARFNGFKSGNKNNTFKWNVSPESDPIKINEDYAYIPRTATVDLNTDVNTNYEVPPSLFDEGDKPITTVNGRKPINGDFGIVYDICTTKQALPKPIKLPQIDLSQLLIEIPKGSDGPLESYKRLPLDIGGVETEELIRARYGFNRADRESKPWCYNVYNMKLGEHGYFDIEDCPPGCRPPFGGQPLDTTLDTHVRISLLESVKSLANDRPWLDLNEKLGITMMTDPIFSVFSINKTGYQDSARGGDSPPGSKSGYFSIVKTEADEYCICDYATYDEKKKESGPSPAKIIKRGNTQDYSVEYQEFDIDKDYTHVVLLKALAQGSNAAKWTVSYEILKSKKDNIKVPVDTDTTRYIRIGRVTRTGAEHEMKIYQEHDGEAIFDFDDGSEYFGDFTINDTSTYNPKTGELETARITISKGIDEQAASTCRVNNITFEVEPATLTGFGSKTKNIVIVVNIPKAELSEGVATIELMDSVPSDSAEKVHYLLGSVRVTNGAVVISQDHTTGIPQLYWYLPCDYGEEEDNTAE